MNYYLGLDAGTNSIGWACTDSNFELLRNDAGDMWGSHLFSEGEVCKDRRMHRSSRRRLRREKWRLGLLRDIFEPYINPVDSLFFTRIKESGLKRDQAISPYSIFDDEGFTDRQFYKNYPTIHHLLKELLSEPTKDVRLLYVAIAWLITNRGHFLDGVPHFNSEEDEEKGSTQKGFNYYFEEVSSKASRLNDSIKAEMSFWKENKDRLHNFLLKTNLPKREKADNLIELIGLSKRYDSYLLCTLLSGSEVSAKKMNSIFHSIDPDLSSKFQLDTSDENFIKQIDEITDFDEKAAYISLHDLYRSLKAEIIMRGFRWISDYKVNLYDKNKEILKNFRELIRKHFPENYKSILKEYNPIEILKDLQKEKKDRKDPLNLNSEINDKEDLENLNFLKNRLVLQRNNVDNPNIPCRYYFEELEEILNVQKSVFPWLKEKDSKYGISNATKILKLFTFKIPYYVGPLNHDSPFGWIETNGTEPITPWNFDLMVNKEKSEEAFIKRMVKSCTYLYGEPVLAKNSLLYSEFTMLNIINGIKINGLTLDECDDGRIKDKLLELFKSSSSISKSTIVQKLIASNLIGKDDELSGLDDSTKKDDPDKKISIKIDSDSFRDFYPGGTPRYESLGREDVEAIITRMAFIHEPDVFQNWLCREYGSKLTDKQIKEICGYGMEGFGNLSRKLLDGIRSTGTGQTVIEIMKSTSKTLMQVLSFPDYGFSSVLKKHNQKYLEDQKGHLNDRMNELYLSNPVKRTIFRTLACVDEITKVMGSAPEKIIIEMPRGEDKKAKGKHTETRLKYLENLKNNGINKILEELKSRCDTEDLNKNLNSRRLFLYCLQQGKDLYNGRPINLDDLLTGKKSGSYLLYDIEHIVPQSRLKDDSLDNICLVSHTQNEQKGSSYPLDRKIINAQQGWWKELVKIGAMSSKKYERLVRTKDLTADDFGFVNRQLVETRQSTKALSILLKEKYPTSEICYPAASFASKLRDEYGIAKSRELNNTHHAKDAYLNILADNLMHQYRENGYSFDRKDLDLSLFDRHLKSTEQNPIPTILKNTVRLTSFSSLGHGGLYDETLTAPSKIEQSSRFRYTGIKRNLPVQDYGGHGKQTLYCWIPIKFEYESRKKTIKDALLLPIDLVDRRHVDRLNLNEDRSFFIDKISQFTGKTVLSIEAFGKYSRPLKIGSLIKVGKDGKSLLLTLRGKTGNGFTFDMSHNPVYLESTHRFREHDRDWESAEAYFSRIEKYVQKKAAKQAVTPYLLNSEDNYELYKILTDILKKNSFSILSITQAVIKKLEETEDKFKTAPLDRQAIFLSNLMQWITQAKLISFKDFNGTKQTGLQRLSVQFSTLHNFDYLQIVDFSPAGNFVSYSPNLLKLVNK